MVPVGVAQYHEEVFVVKHEVRAFVEDGQDMQCLLEFSGMAAGRAQPSAACPQA